MPQGSRPQACSWAVHPAAKTGWQWCECVRCMCWWQLFGSTITAVCIPLLVSGTALAADARHAWWRMQLLQRLKLAAVLPGIAAVYGYTFQPCAVAWLLGLSGTVTPRHVVTRSALSHLASLARLRRLLRLSGRRWRWRYFGDVVCACVGLEQHLSDGFAEGGFDSRVSRPNCT
jgi:hypothetical protein